MKKEDSVLSCQELYIEKQNSEFLNFHQKIDEEIFLPRIDFGGEEERYTDEFP